MALVGIFILVKSGLFFKDVWLVLWHHSKQLLPTLQGHHAFLLGFQLESSDVSTGVRF